jgi:hypothetical protein
MTEGQMRFNDRSGADPELANVAFHESGHAIVALLVFARAQWLPYGRPRLPVQRIEITEHDGHYSGFCKGPDIYSTRWPEHRIHNRYRGLMEKQIMIHYAGGIASAILSGANPTPTLLRDAMADYGMIADMENVKPVIEDVCRLRGKFDEARNIDRATAMLRRHWAHVTALAQALMVRRTIEWP